MTRAGTVAGNDAAAAAQGRAQQGQLQQGQDRNALGLYDAKLRAAQQALNQNSLLAHQAAQGGLMSNVQDVGINGLPDYIRKPTLSGGLRPSALGPGAKQAGSELQRRAILQLLAGPTNLPQAPTLTPLPNASGYDTANKWLGRAGAYAGALFPPSPYGQMGQPGSPGYVPGNVMNGNIPMDPEDPMNASPLDPRLLPGYQSGSF